MKRKKIHVVHLDKGYNYETRGEKTHGRDKLYARGGGLGWVVADCKSKDRGRSN